MQITTTMSAEDDISIVTIEHFGLTQAMQFSTLSLDIIFRLFEFFFPEQKCLCANIKGH